MRRRPIFEQLRRHPGVAGVILFGVLCRAAIPAGFMPAPLGEGGPFTICHGGLAGEFFRDLAEAQHAAQDAHAQHDLPAAEHPPAHADESGSVHEAFEQCPVGAVLATAALAGEFQFALLALEHALESTEPALPARAVLTASYQARAPPAVSSRLIV